MQDVDDNNVLISLDDQSKIGVLLNEIFEALRIEVFHECREKEFNSKEILVIYRKLQADYELENLINELIEERINNLINQAGIDEEKIEQIRHDVLMASLEKFFRENSSSKTFASFSDPLIMSYLKLIGKQELLANNGTSIKPFSNIIDELSLSIGWPSMMSIMPNNMFALENCYDTILNKTIGNLALYLECKEKEDRYLANYIEALNRILESKYREEYKKTIQAVYKAIRKEKLIKKRSGGLTVKRLPAYVAYNGVVETCNNKIKTSNLGFNKSGSCCFSISKEDVNKETISDVLEKRLDAYTFTSNLGREALTLEEIKAIEEKIHNNEVEDYEEEITVLLNLRKKGNSETEANN